MSTKPRMGDTANTLWAAIRSAAGGVVCDGRILYPVLRVVCGEDFTLSATLKLQILSMHGMAARDATDSEADEFHRDLSRDGVQVLLMTQPGYHSDYKRRRVLRELHSPSGLSFKTLAPTKPAAARPLATTP